MDRDGRLVENTYLNKSCELQVLVSAIKIPCHNSGLRLSTISLDTHICPVKSRGALHPEGSLPNLHSAGLYDLETDGNTKTYLEENMTRKEEGEEKRDRFRGVMK